MRADSLALPYYWLRNRQIAREKAHRAGFFITQRVEIMKQKLYDFFIDPNKVSIGNTITWEFPQIVELFLIITIALVLKTTLDANLSGIDLAQGKFATRMLLDIWAATFFGRIVFTRRGMITFLAINVAINIILLVIRTG